MTGLIFTREVKVSMVNLFKPKSQIRDGTAIDKSDSFKQPRLHL